MRLLWRAHRPVRQVLRGLLELEQAQELQPPQEQVQEPELALLEPKQREQGLVPERERFYP